MASSFLRVGLVLLAILGAAIGITKAAHVLANAIADRDRAEANADRLLKERQADSLSRARALAIADSFKEAARIHAEEAAKASADAARASRKLRALSDSAARLSAKLDSAEADTTRPQPAAADYRLAWLAERDANLQATATITALARDTLALHEQLADERRRGDTLQVALNRAVTRISDVTSGLDTLRTATRCRLFGFLPICVSPTVGFGLGAGAGVLSALLLKR